MALRYRGSDAGPPTPMPQEDAGSAADRLADGGCAARPCHPGHCFRDASAFGGRSTTLCDGAKWLGHHDPDYPARCPCQAASTADRRFSVGSRFRRAPRHGQTASPGPRMAHHTGAQPPRAAASQAAARRRPADFADMADPLSPWRRNAFGQGICAAGGHSPEAGRSPGRNGCAAVQATANSWGCGMGRHRRMAETPDPPVGWRRALAGMPIRSGTGFRHRPPGCPVADRSAGPSDHSRAAGGHRRSHPDCATGCSCR